MVYYSTIVAFVALAAVAYGQETTESPNQKYVEACQAKYPDEANVTAVVTKVGALEACSYICASVQRRWSALNIFDVEISKQLGDKEPIEDGTRCAPSRKCLGGECQRSEEIEECSKAQNGLTKIDHSSQCKVKCVGADENNASELNVHQGEPCMTSKSVFGINVPVPGLCRDGKCKTF